MYCKSARGDADPGIPEDHGNDRGAIGFAEKQLTMTLFGVHVTPLLSLAVVCTLIAAILISIEVGYRVGIRRCAGLEPPARLLSPTMEGSVFGLVGPLVAFVFYRAGARFDAR